MIGDEAKNAPSRLTRIGGLAKQLHDDGFRNSYLSRQLKAFLAAQIRALRGEKTQTAFGKDLGKPQSVVSRLENERLSGLHVQTLIDIAQKLKIGVIIRFVEFTEFLRYTEDYSDQALAPAPYDQGKVDGLARWSESLSFEPSQTQLAQIDKELVSDEPTFFDSSNSWFLANLGASQFTYEDLYHHSKLDIVWPNLSGLALTNTYSPSVAKSTRLKLHRAERKILELEKEVQRLNDERNRLLHNQGFEFQQYSHIDSEAMIRRDQQRSGLII